MSEPVYWFPAKRCGWGWGPPAAWQGRAVLGVFFALLTIGAVVLLPSAGPLAFVTFSVGLVALLLIVCMIKGEPPGRQHRARGYAEAP